MAAVIDPSQLNPEYLAEDQRTPARIGIVVTTVVSGITVLLRLYSRLHIVRQFGLDDYLICAAMLLNIAIMALSLKVLDNGAGQHLYALIQDPPKLVRLYKFLVAAQLIYMIALWICRVSGLAFYKRLNSSPRFVLYLRIAMAFVTSTFLAQLFIIALQCIPLQGLWDTTIKAQCMSSRAVFISTAAMTIACDAIILLLPLNIVWNLHANKKRKFGLAVVLCFGIFAVVTSCFRIDAMIPAVSNPDATWYFSTVMVWSDTEVSTAIIALSLPALKPLFGSLLKSGSTNNSTETPKTVNLRTFGSGGGGPVYRGPNSHPTDTKVLGDNESEEDLWPDGNGGITTKSTYQVDVRDMSRSASRNV